MDCKNTWERIWIWVPLSRISEARENDEGVQTVKTESTQPTYSNGEGRTKGTLVALFNLLLSISLLLSLCATWFFVPIARDPAVCVFHNKPWWFSLTEGSALVLIPASIVLGRVAVRTSKQGYRGHRLRSLGIMTIVLGTLLILSLAWAEFLYFVCQL